MKSKMSRRGFIGSAASERRRGVARFRRYFHADHVASPFFADVY